MPWLGHKAPGQQPWVLPPAKGECTRDTGMSWLGCPAARAPTVPRWLNVCGLVSCAGWSQLWLGSQNHGSLPNPYFVCVCVRHVRPSARALSEIGSFHAPFFSPVHALHIPNESIVRPMRVNPCASIHARQSMRVNLLLLRLDARQPALEVIEVRDALLLLLLTDARQPAYSQPAYSQPCL